MGRHAPVAPPCTPTHPPPPPLPRSLTHKHTRLLLWPRLLLLLLLHVGVCQTAAAAARTTLLPSPGDRRGG